MSDSFGRPYVKSPVGQTRVSWPHGSSRTICAGRHRKDDEIMSFSLPDAGAHRSEVQHSTTRMYILYRQTGTMGHYYW